MEGKLEQEMFDCLAKIDSHVRQYDLGNKYSHSPASARAEYYKLTGVFEGFWNALQIVRPGSYPFLNPVVLFGSIED